MLKSKDDENAEKTVSDTDDEKNIENRNSKTPTADRDTNVDVPSATDDGEHANNSSSNDTQENH